MRSGLKCPAGLDDRTAIDEPPNGPVAGHRGGAEGDRGVSGVYAGRDLVAVARAWGDDLKLGSASPRRRLCRRRVTRRRLTSAVLLGPLDVLRRPDHRAAPMPVTVLLRRRTRQEPLVEIRAATGRPQAGQRANP